MKESDMPRRIPASLLIVLLYGAFAEAQWIPAGSTPQGDYLRGVGVAGWGMGLYNLNTAQANQINAQTSIMMNEYIWACYKNDIKEKAEHRKMILANKARAYKEIQDKLRNQPESTDVMSGAALNAQLKDLKDPRVSDSASRYVKVALDDGVPLDASVIKRIHFQLGEKGNQFSMSRLSLKGKKKWAVAFEDPKFALYCRSYERAVDDALDLAIDGRMNDNALKAIQKAVDDLEFKVSQTPELRDPRNQQLYSEAKEQLNRLQKSVRLFQTLPMQKIFAAIDTYSGTNVDELRVFMRTHGLTFAPAELAEEKALYPQLHAALLEQRRKTIPD
jgi:signal recognition particle subunit SEC65